MKNKSIKIRVLIFAATVIGFVVLWQALKTHCPQRPKQLDINAAINIHNLYPWPGAKIPFVCHIQDFVESPFAPRLIDLYEMVFKEDGLRILRGSRREGVVNADISIAGDLLPVFSGDLQPVLDQPIESRKTPLFVESVSFYVDDKKLNMGHIGWTELNLEFNFATSLNPFLLPGTHIGKIILLLPSGEAREYQWHFEIIWW